MVHLLHRILWCGSCVGLLTVHARVYVCVCVCVLGGNAHTHRRARARTRAIILLTFRPQNAPHDLTKQCHYLRQTARVGAEDNAAFYPAVQLNCLIRHWFVTSLTRHLRKDTSPTLQTLSMGQSEAYPSPKTAGALFFSGTDSKRTRTP